MKRNLDRLNDINVSDNDVENDFIEKINYDFLFYKNTIQKSE
jgi:hypothetical protein